MCGELQLVEKAALSRRVLVTHEECTGGVCHSFVGVQVLQAGSLLVFYRLETFLNAFQACFRSFGSLWYTVRDSGVAGKSARCTKIDAAT